MSGDLESSVAETVMHYAAADPRDPVAVAISLDGLTDDALLKLKSQVDYAASKRGLVIPGRE